MIFVDANVLMEVIEKRRHAAVCERLLTNEQDKAISLLTLDLVLYFVERDKLAWEPVRTFLESFVWLPLLEADAQWAFTHFGGKDFEDALQISCALREHCQRFVTLDKQLSKKYAAEIPIDLLH